MLRTLRSSLSCHRRVGALFLTATALMAATSDSPSKAPLVVRPETRLRTKFASVTLRPAYGGQDGHKFPIATSSLTPLSLASADLNGDGYPDLVVGYATRDGGLLAVHFANAEAFAPQTRQSLEGIAQGRFPESFGNTATMIPVPCAPEFLAAGDFNQDGRTSILLAARGGNRFYIVAVEGGGSFGQPTAVSVPGKITALAAGALQRGGAAAGVVVGIDDRGGSSVLVYDPSRGGPLSPPSITAVGAPVTNLAIGDLDGDPYNDVAIVAGGRLLILHGGVAAPGGGQDRLEAVDLAFGVQTAALGRYIPERLHGSQLALAADDGSVRVMAQGQPDNRPLSVPELQARRAAARPGTGAAGSRSGWRRGGSEPWQTVQTIAPPMPQPGVARLLTARLSGGAGDDLLAVDVAGNQVRVLNSRPGQAAPAAARPSLQLAATLETDGAPVAVLPMRLNVMGSYGLVTLTEGELAPLVTAPQPNNIFHVTALGDSQTGTCTTPSGSPAASTCTTLRAAVLAANSYYGEDLIVFDVNGVVTLSVAGRDDAGLVGDLDVTDALTIVGNGVSNTVIQGGASAATGIDKVFSFNPLGGVPGFPVSLSGLTIQFGRNTSTDFSVGDNEGGAFDFDASAEDGAGSLTVTNCSILQNSTVNGDGGGIALFDGGVVTITGTVISGNTANTQGATQFYGGGVFVGNAQPFPASITITGSALTGNAAANGGGGAYAYGPGLAVSGSRLGGNTAGQGSPALDGFIGTATVAASNNWWGSNGSPASQVNSAVVTFAPWLVMTLAAPSSVYAGGTGTLTASIAKGSDGSTGFSAPDGTPAAFAGTLGTVSPASATTVAGSAGTTYTAGSAAGAASVSAAIDNQTLTASFNVSLPPPPTLSSISPASGVQGTSVPVTLTGTNFVSGATVAVSNTGVPVSRVTVVSATQITATFTISPTAAVGAANVTVTTSGGTSNAVPFTVISSVVAAPVFTPAGGTYATAQPVTLSTATSGATIRYTTDGSTPTDSYGSVYTAPIMVTSANTINAIAFMSGLTDSPLASATYTVKTPSGMPFVPVLGDATISSTSASSNFGGLTTLNTGAGSSALIQFNLSALPPALLASSVQRATLSLWIDRLSAAGSVAIAPVNGPWTEGAVTLNSAPAAGAVVGVVPVTQVSSWITLDVTGLVQTWIATPSSNFGIQVSPSVASPNTNVSFDSKENISTSHPARLDLVLSSAAPLVTATVADALVNPAAPSTNYGPTVQLNVNGTTSQSSFVAFDLSGLPAGALASDVSQATMFLWEDKVGNATGTFDVSQVTGPWSESTVTFNTAPATGPAQISSPAQPVYQWLALDVTGIAKAWVANSASNFGVALSPSPSSSIAVFFDSKENTSTKNAARLQVFLQAGTPSLSPAAGAYNSAQTVTLASTTTGASIRYTTDGTDPTSTTGVVYIGPITVSGTTTIKAIAYKAGWLDSIPALAVYTIAR